MVTLSMGAPARPDKSPSQTLTAAEREIILTIADDEDTWTVYTDSRRALGAALLRAARRWGVEPVRIGSHGWEVRLPVQAVRFAGPPSARALAQRRRAAEAAQNARRASEIQRTRRPAGGLPAPGGSEIPAALSSQQSWAQERLFSGG